MQLKLVNIFYTSVLFFFLFTGFTIAAPHRANLHVNITNKSTNNYLYESASLQPNIASVQYITSHQNAVAGITTPNAFVVERHMMGISGDAPIVSFIYKNQTDGTICSFTFDGHGLNVVKDNGHCAAENKDNSISFWVIKNSWESSIIIT